LIVAQIAWSEFKLGSGAWDRVQNSGLGSFFFAQYPQRLSPPSLTSLPCFVLFAQNIFFPHFYRFNSILLQFINRLRETSYRWKESRKNPSIHQFDRLFEGIFEFKFKIEFMKISNFIRFS
jgi:hypothetical protein